MATGALGELGASAARIVTRENIIVRDCACINHTAVRSSRSRAREAVIYTRNLVT